MIDAYTFSYMPVIGSQRIVDLMLPECNSGYCSGGYTKRLGYRSATPVIDINFENKMWALDHLGTTLPVNVYTTLKGW